MKKRLARKIIKTIRRFESGESDYQPYSENQERKAIVITLRSYSHDFKVFIKPYIIYSVPREFRVKKTTLYP